MPFHILVYLLTMITGSKQLLLIYWDEYKTYRDEYTIKVSMNFPIHIWSGSMVKEKYIIFLREVCCGKRVERNNICIIIAFQCSHIKELNLGRKYI